MENYFYTRFSIEINGALVMIVVVCVIVIYMINPTKRMDGLPFFFLDD